jgi:hypothetical protein
MLGDSSMISGFLEKFRLVDYDCDVFDCVSGMEGANLETHLHLASQLVLFGSGSKI